MKKKTVGAHSLELSQKAPESTDPIELERAMQEDYIKELGVSVDNGLKLWDTGNFYIQVITKNEKLMPNVFRNYFVPVRYCPTPQYDQTIFRYRSESGSLEYIWTVPCKDTVNHLLTYSNEVVQAERELLLMCKKFIDGSLDKLCRKLNGELSESTKIIN